MLKSVKFTLDATVEQHTELLKLQKAIRYAFNDVSTWNRFYFCTDNMNSLHRRYYNKLKSTYPELKSVYIKNILKEISNVYSKLKRKHYSCRRKLLFLSDKKNIHSNTDVLTELQSIIQYTKTYIPKLYHIIPIGNNCVKIMSNGDLCISNLSDSNNKLYIKILYNDYNRHYSHGKFSICNGYFYYSKLYKKWHICLRFNIPEARCDRPYIYTVGIDRGISHTVALSDNTIFEYDPILKQKIQSLSTLKDKLDNVHTSSARKHRKKILSKISNIHKYMCHTLSKQIVSHIVKKGYTHIAFENLNYINVTSVWNKWNTYRLFSYIKYKAQLHGICVYTIDPVYTSKRCHVCHRFGIRHGDDFYCDTHGHMHADVNAACNIAGRYRDRSTRSSILSTHASMDLYGMVYKDVYTIDDTQLRPYRHK